MLRPHPIPKALLAQQDFFREGNTLPVRSRLSVLRQIRLAVHAMEAEVLAAIAADIGKSSAEAYLGEVGLLYAEIRHMTKHLKRYAKPRAVRPMAGQLPARAEVRPVPRGNVLIITPWNYPFSLALLPAVDAIAAGNTVIIKPSEFAPTTAAVLKDLCERYLPQEWISVIPGDEAVSRALVEQPFHHIFYTGGGRVGGLIMQRAARRLIPVTLELGGKCPCIVAEDANIKLAAQRIIFGKFMNCGQTCVAPDHVYVHSTVREELLREMEATLLRFYGESPLDSPDYGRIINRAHFDRLMALLDGESPLVGGHARPDKLQIAPTIVEVTADSPLMEDEVFGPILPVLTYDDLEVPIAGIRSLPTPLAFYLFSQDKSLQKRLMLQLPFGGGCVNDTLLHLCSPRLSFGGLGESGMGAYHGKAGFDTFSHQKSILYQSGHIDLPLRYPPYSTLTERLLRLVLR